MTKKRVLIFVSTIIFLIVAVVAGFIGYLQLSTFTLEPIEKDALDYYVKNLGFDSLEHVEKNKYSGSIPYEVFSDQVSEKFIIENQEGDSRVSGANIDLITGSAKVNYEVQSFYVPIQYSVTYEMVDESLVVSLKPEGYGDRDIDLPDFLDECFFSANYSTKTITIDLEQYDYNDLFAFEGAFADEDALVFELGLILPDVGELIGLITNDLDPDHVGIYSEGSFEQKLALSWLKEYEKNEERTTSKLFEDFIDGGEVLNYILPLAKPATLMKIYEEYPELRTVASESAVLEVRGQLIGESVEVYGQYILEGLKVLSEEGNLIVSQGYPFDYLNFETITIDKIIELYGIEIPEDILSRMSMAYTGGQVYIVYESEEDLIIAISESGYKNLTLDEKEANYTFDIPEEGEVTADLNTYQELVAALEDHYGEGVFVRYLKNDSDEAYGIISLASDYQNFILVALKKLGDEYEVYAEGFDTALELNRMNPDFNMNLVTRMNEGNEILNLNYKTKSNIIDGLREKGYKDSDEDLIYCSYDGVRYIAIELSSGERYVYTIYRGVFLEKIYLMETAVELFSDIDPLILLQPIPSELEDGLEEAELYDELEDELNQEDEFNAEDSLNTDETTEG